MKLRLTQPANRAGTGVYLGLTKEAIESSLFYSQRKLTIDIMTANIRNEFLHEKAKFFRFFSDSSSEFFLVKLVAPSAGKLLQPSVLHLQ